MADMLFFTLWAPLGAMGDVAVGERRAGFDRPGRSALLGLIAAALGFDRDDAEGHDALDAAYGLAIRILGRGDLLEDYYTVQAPKARKGRTFATRRDALAADDVGTLLSLRDYRTDPISTVALVARSTDDAAPGLAAIAEALRRPHFVTYFGRKSCPLGLPLRPTLGAFSSLAAGFTAYDDAQTDLERTTRRSLKIDAVEAPIYADLDLEPLLTPGTELLRRELRRDQPANRWRWQFDLRAELVARPVRAST